MNKLEYCLAQIAHQVTETDELMGELIDMLAARLTATNPRRKKTLTWVMSS